MNGLRVLLTSLAVGLLGLPSFSQSLYCFAEQGDLSSSTPGFNGGPVASDGDRAIVGDQGFGDYGAAAIFKRNGDTWIEEAFLVPTASPTFGESFGVSVDIDGEWAVIGAWEGCWDAWGPLGCAYVYRLKAGSWVFQQKLEETSLSYFSFYGASVSIDGDTMAIAADFSSRVFIYVLNGGSWVKESVINGPNGGTFGASMALEKGVPQSTLIVGAPNADISNQSNTGSAYAYVGNGANWNLQFTFSPSPLRQNRYVGRGIALSGDTALIGAPRESDGSVRSGAVYAYRRTANQWSLEEKIISPNGQFEDNFGQSVSLSNQQAVIGASGEDLFSNNHGNAYFVYRTGTTWSSPVPLLPDSLSMTYNRLGLSLELVGNTVVAGSVPSARVLVPKTRVGVAYCECSSGPCGNSDSLAGCVNSTGQGGLLGAQSSDTLEDVDLLVSQAVPGVFGLFFQGDAAVQLPFGDGLLCAGQGIVRLSPLPTQVSPDGSATWGPCVGDPSIPSVTGVVLGSGVVKRYQFWYRDPSGPCGNGFNTTNALELTW